MGSGVFVEEWGVTCSRDKMENSRLDGGNTAEEKRRRFWGVEKEIGGREYECCYGYGLRWEVRWRGREKKDVGETAPRSVSGRFLIDWNVITEDMDVITAQISSSRWIMTCGFFYGLGTLFPLSSAIPFLY
jgi:hypothetical protein